MLHDAEIQVAALAGRRIDAPDDERRFAIDQIPAVRIALRTLLKLSSVKTLISSAACGADLLAIDEALALGLRCQIILPFAPDQFKKASVTDRPGEWGNLYDAVINVVSQRDDLTVFDNYTNPETGYSLVTRAIVQRAKDLAGSHPALAIIVWEGKRRGANDETAQFQELAKAAGMLIETISTCSPSLAV